jgi:guanylate kinase
MTSGAGPASAGGGAPVRGRLVVVSGPSGVGKTALVDRLLEDPRFARAVTATTRPPRGAERDGVDYVFLSAEEFRRRVGAGWFLEHAEVYGRSYGTPRDAVDDACLAGRHCLLNIDVQGAATLRRLGVDALFVFVAPPSLEELERRIRRRGQDGPEVAARRLAAAAGELERQGEFDLVVVNDDLEATARRLAAALGVTLGEPPRRAPAGGGRAQGSEPGPV